MTEFLDMGGYAAFVWPSWIVAVVVILCISIMSYRHDCNIKTETDRLDAMMMKSKKGKSDG